MSDLISRGVDAYNLYYAPHQLDLPVYNTAVTNNEVLVTLAPLSEGRAVTIPMSYLLTAPTEISVPYQRSIVSLDFGLIPTVLSFNHCLADLQDLAYNAMGVIAAVKLHTVNADTPVVYSDHMQREAIRLAKIKSHTSFYAGKILAEERLRIALDKLSALEKIVGALH
jgi:hypothetical protein